MLEVLILYTTYLDNIELANATKIKAEHSLQACIMNKGDNIKERLQR